METATSDARRLASLLDPDRPKDRVLARAGLDPAHLANLEAALSRTNAGTRETAQEPSGRLLAGLANLARALASPPVSGFRVGCAALSRSGRVYLGANVEFPDLPPQFALHAEQSTIQAALLAGDTDLTRLAVTAAPCGHCRQFLQELAGAKDLRVLVGESPENDSSFRGKTETGDLALADLLPAAFGPPDLGIAAALGQTPEPFVNHPTEPPPGRPQGQPRGQPRGRPLGRPYAPYTGAGTRVRLRLHDSDPDRDLQLAGLGVESAAWNPGLLAVIAAFGQAAHFTVDHARIKAVDLTFDQAISKTGLNPDGEQREHQERATRAAEAYGATTAFIAGRLAPGAQCTWRPG